MNDTILVIDIGNTSTSIGLFRRGAVVRGSRIDTTVRDRARLTQVLKKVAGHHRMAGASVCSVVPAVNSLWKSLLKRCVHGTVLWVNHRLQLGVKVTYPHPGTIGADRLANACGAVSRYGAPVIVADFGTALTFDLVSRSQGYIGGIIAPGLPLMFSYLAEKTAQLPLLDLGPVRHAVGKSTAEAMRLGAWWGYRGMVREILKQVKRHVGPGPLKLCATGGYAGRVLEGFKPALKIDPELTLYGAGRIFELNQ